MLLNYLWLYSVIFTFNINFSFSLDFVDLTSKPSYSMAVNLDCYLSESSSVELTYIRIIVMLIIMITQIIIICLGAIIYSLIFQQQYDLSDITNAIICIYISNQAVLTEKFSSLIAIRTISDIDYVQGNVALQFYQNEHHQWLKIFIYPGLAISGCVIPISLFVILFANKNKFNFLNFRKHVCYLCNDYNNNNYFWELSKILKRTIIIILLTSFETNIDLKAFLICLTMLCYQLLSVKCKPYVLSSLNELDIESIVIVLVTILFAAVQNVSQSNNTSETVAALLSSIIFLLFLRLCFSFIFNILRVYIKKYKILVLVYIYTFAAQVKRDSGVVSTLQIYINKSKKQQKRLKENYTKMRFLLILLKSDKIENYKKPTKKTNIRLFSDEGSKKVLLSKFTSASFTSG